MSTKGVGFEETLALVRKLPRDEQIRLFKAVGLNAPGAVEGERRPPPEAGSEYFCGTCGAMLPSDEMPPECPSCGAPRDRFVLEEED